ncbi:MAG TPA: hypothetical protein V6D50_22660 [Chroococcales cyanobacterium]
MIEKSRSLYLPAATCWLTTEFFGQITFFLHPFQSLIHVGAYGLAGISSASSED